MGDRTGIQWTDATWNPLRGCSRVSEGCRNCYAERVAARFSGPGQPYEGLARMRSRTTVIGPPGAPYGETTPHWTGVVKLVEEHLAAPLRWKRPRRIFVNSMSDLFHERVPDEWIDRIFAVMALSPQHTFQVLTKRPERMLAQLRRARMYDGVLRAAEEFRRAFPRTTRAPVSDPTLHGLPNVWLGVSVEDQRTADARIPLLLGTPAAVRFVSYEPALGPVDFRRCTCGHNHVETDEHAPRCGINGLDQIIVGGESGPGARPCDVAWIRSTRDQCKAAGVACFVKQLGARPAGGNSADWEWTRWRALGASVTSDGAILLSDRKGGDWSEWPEDLRVREFPAVRP